VKNQYQGIPLFNVIDPGAKAAVEVTKNKKIGVIGTSTTIMGHSYKKKLLQLDPSLTVFEKSCPLFVPLAEEGLVEDEITTLAVMRYLTEIKQQQVDTLILGCTHYPLLTKEIARFMGPEITLIESGEVLAKLIDPHVSNAGTGQISICATDVTEHFYRLAQKIMGEDLLPKIEHIVL
jgi:glutamate racemase